MADVKNIITLGIGASPGKLLWFITGGLEAGEPPIFAGTDKKKPPDYILEQRAKFQREYLERERMIEMKKSEELTQKLVKADQTNQGLLKTVQVIHKQSAEQLAEERARLEPVIQALAGVLETPPPVKQQNPVTLAKRMIALEKANAALEEKKRQEEARNQQRLKNLQKARRVLKKSRQK